MGTIGRFFSTLFKKNGGSNQAETENWLARISDSHVFSDLSEDTLTEMSTRLVTESHSAGDVIIREDQEGDAFYIIASGKCRVTKREGGGESVLAVIGPGTGFGEEALISNAKRNATVTMLEDGTLMRLGKDEFNELLKEPQLTWFSRVQAQREIQNGAVWLDVRSQADFARGNLPGALSIPLNSLRTTAGELDRAKLYICCCRNGRQSATAAFLLKQMGFNVGVLRGGLKRLPGFE
jgi:rhodanese-related sulfurtransferase